jgi:SAM-dependent methyltransferase
MTFLNAQLSHAHSLETLDTLYNYIDFMESIGTLVDMGCGSGLDLEWWATRTTSEDNPQPLNIRCTGVDQAPALSMASKYSNIQYRSQNFEDAFLINKRKFDVLWCHDAFQYAVNPFNTLKLWRDIVSENGMMVLILPQTTNLEYNTQAFDQTDGCYYNWTIVSLIHMLAVSGWDCAGGFFRKHPDSPWLHAVVYKSEHEPMDPRTTRWFDLAERNLLPRSAVDSLNRVGHVRQRDLILPWLDQSLMSFQHH